MYLLTYENNECTCTGEYNSELDLQGILDGCRVIISPDDLDDLLAITRAYDHLIKKDIIDPLNIKKGAQRLLISRFLFKLEKYVTLDMMCTYNQVVSNCPGCSATMITSNICDCGFIISEHPTSNAEDQLTTQEPRYSERNNFLTCLNRH
jgi:hypothetical protein